MNTTDRTKEMLEIAGNLLDALHCVSSYNRFCIAENYVHDFKTAYGDLPGATEKFNTMKQVLACRRRIVRLNERPAPFDYRYNLEG